MSSYEEGICRVQDFQKLGGSLFERPYITDEAIWVLDLKLAYRSGIGLANRP